jgi:hypothetical protein
MVGARQRPPRADRVWANRPNRDDSPLPTLSRESALLRGDADIVDAESLLLRSIVKIKFG